MRRDRSVRYSIVDNLTNNNYYDLKICVKITQINHIQSHLVSKFLFIIMCTSKIMIKYVIKVTSEKNNLSRSS